MIHKGTSRNAALTDPIQEIRPLDWPALIFGS